MSRTLKLIVMGTTALLISGTALAKPQADIDQDGRISQSEFLAAADDRFSTADTNFDGVLTSDEKDAAKAQRRGKMKEKIGEKVFGKLDVNGDGFITTDEFDTAAQARADRPGKVGKDGKNRFEKLDVNGDSFVTKDEFDTAMQARGERGKKDGKKRAAKGDGEGRLGKRIKNRIDPDANADGVITRDEAQASALTMFARLDADGDGFLTEGEGRKRKGKRKGKRKE